MEKFKRLLPTILMLVFELAIGILLLIDGEKFTEVIFIIFGVFLLIVGLITLIRSLMASRNGGAIPMLPLILSVILLAVGGFFTAASGSVLSIMSAVTLVFGIIVAFNGMLKLVDSMAMRKDNARVWFAVVAAVVTVILGVVIAFNPFGATEMMWTILGIMIIATAVLDIISLIVFGVALKKMPTNVVEVEVKDIEE